MQFQLLQLKYNFDPYKILDYLYQRLTFCLPMIMPSISSAKMKSTETEPHYKPSNKNNNFNSVKRVKTLTCLCENEYITETLIIYVNHIHLVAEIRQH